MIQAKINEEENYTDVIVEGSFDDIEEEFKQIVAGIKYRLLLTIERVGGTEEEKRKAEKEIDKALMSATKEGLERNPNVLDLQIRKVKEESCSECGNKIVCGEQDKESSWKEGVLRKFNKRY